MNQQVAKQLRKHLKSIEQDSNQKVVAHSYYELEKRRAFQTVDTREVDEDGKPVTERVQIATGQLVVAPGTTRGRYLALKRSIRNLQLKRRAIEVAGGKKAFAKLEEKQKRLKKQEEEHQKRLARRRVRAKAGLERYKIREKKRQEAKAAALAS